MASAFASLAWSRRVVVGLSGGVAGAWVAASGGRSCASCTALDGIEAAKRVAARRAVDRYVRSGQVVGVGSGSTIVYAVERLAELNKADDFSIQCVPTSFQAQQLIVDNGLPLSDLARTPELDVAIDGADEVDGDLNCIKGGGGCHVQEKTVASCAKRFVVVADYRKQAWRLGQKWTKGVPIEVLPFAYAPLMRKIEALGGKAVLRMAKSKAGPCVSDNGNFIIDADFGEITDVAALNDALISMPGVVETGLFVGMAERAYFGQEDGTVQEWTRSPDEE